MNYRKIASISVSQQRTGNKSRCGGIAMTANILTQTSSGLVKVNGKDTGIAALGLTPMMTGRTECLLQEVSKDTPDKETSH